MTATAQQKTKSNERFLVVEPISISLFDFYSSVATKQNISTDEVVNESGHLTKLFSSNGLIFEVPLQAKAEHIQRFRYMSQWADWAQDWLFDVLTGLQIPNEEQALIVNIEHRPRIYRCGIAERQISYERLKVVILPPEFDVTAEIEKALYIKWNPTNPMLTVSMPLLYILWRAVGAICLQRGYVTKEEHDRLFTATAWEEASKRTYDYFNDQRQHLPNKDADAWFVAPHFEFPKSAPEPTEEELEEESESENGEEARTE